MNKQAEQGLVKERARNEQGTKKGHTPKIQL